MTVADGSQVRLADVSEVTIGTTPATPAFQIMRYLNADVRINKQTDIPNEVRSDRNVSSIVDVGRSVQGTIRTNMSYGTFDTWLERLLCSTWATDVLKNGILQQAGTLEMFYEQGATDTYVRYQACRFNTLAMQLTAKQAITADFGILGIRSPTPTNAIITGATYADPTDTPIMNAGLNVANLTFTGISSAPKIKSLSLNITNNIYAVDVVGSYEPYAHGLGRFELTGSIETLFENLDTYNAILNHSDVGIAFTIGNDTNQKYTFNIPTVKLMDGGPSAPGNGQAVTLQVPFQAYFDPTSAASLSITRNVA